MTRSIPFLSSLLGWFAKSQTPAPTVSAQAESAERSLIRLHRMLTMRGPAGIQLMTNEMNTESVLFQTTSRGLEEGRKFRLEALLQGEGSIEMEATVEWVLKSAVGWRGQLSLKVAEKHRGALARFLMRQSQGRRG